MGESNVAHKAYAYVVRERASVIEVLTFTHRDVPEAGVQVPKGGMEPGEIAIAAARREAEEETGLRQATLLGEIAHDTWTDAAGTTQERTFVAFRAPATVAERWEHTVRSHGEDDGMVFVCRWLPLAEAARDLVPGHGAYLERAAALLRAEVDHTFTPLTQNDLAVLATWRYEGPYSVYSMGGDPQDPDESADEMLDPRSPNYAVRDASGNLVGFFGYGTSNEPWDHREPALYANPARMLAIGLGMRPDLTGRGQGLAFVRAGLAFGTVRFAPASFRLYVYPWNRRATRVYERAGFRVSGTLSMGRPWGEQTFLEMRRPAEEPTADGRV